MGSVRAMSGRATGGTTGSAAMARARRRASPAAAFLIACLAVLAGGLASARPASADEATAQIYRVAGSQRLEGRVSVEHECEGSPCEWSAQVSAYPLASECPPEFEAAQRVWVSRTRQSSGSAVAHFSFAEPEPGEAAATLCLYVELPLEGESELVEIVSETAGAPTRSEEAPGSGGGRAGGGSPGGAPHAHTGPQSTRAVIYSPFGRGGRSALHTHTARGVCLGGSQAADRRDAWRCVSGGRTHDPCFSSSASSRSVVCPGAPWSASALRLLLAHPLPERRANGPQPSLREQPWAIELSDGRRALSATGATALVGGVRLDYVLAGGQREGLWGAPHRGSQPWRILIAPLDAGRLETWVAIRRAWM